MTGERHEQGPRASAGAHTPGPADPEAVDKDARIRSLEARIAQLEAQSEQEYRSLFDSMDEGFALMEFVRDGRGRIIDCRILDANPAFRSDFGISREQAPLCTVRELLRHQSDPFIEEYIRVVQTGRARRLERYHPGVHNWYEVHAFPRGGDRFAALFKNVTERKRTEQALTESRRKFQALVETNVDFVWETDARGRYTYCSPQMERFWGVSPEAMVGKTLFDWMPPDHRAAAFERFSKTVESPAPFSGLETTSFDSQGRLAFLETNGTPFFDSSGALLGFCGITRDVTVTMRAMQALRETEAQFRALIENVNAGVALIDENGRFSLYNRQFLTLFGLAKDSDIHNVNSQDWRAWSVFDESGRLLDVDEHPVRKAALTAQPVRDQLMRVRPPHGNEDIWMMISAEPLFGAGGEVARIICTYHNVTDRMHAEQGLRASRAKLEAALASMTDAVFISDAEGRVVEFSEAFSAFHGFADRGSCARALREYPESVDVFLADGTLAPRDQWAVPRALRGETVTNAEYTLRRRDTGTTWVGSYSFAPIRDPDGTVVGAVVVGRDVTERRHAENALRQSEEALRVANERLIDADRRKNEFLGVLSHELRNPLAAIENSLYVLGRAVPGGEQAHRAQAIISRQAGQLSRLVDDLLDVTRITRNKIQLHRERLELNDLVKRTLEDYHPAFDKASVRLEFEPAPRPVLVRADWNRLAQVVGNLLQNAAKFTPPDGRVTVSLHADEDSAMAEVRVTDTGLGLTPEVMSHLFEAFAQGDTTLDRTKGGLGLGLALVKGIVELHDGCVSAKSEGLGQGSEFAVRLPLDGTDPVRGEPVPTSGSAVRRRVLVIEDNQDAADSLRDALALEGHEVAVAYNGSDGLDKAREVRPDVVLCDIGLPQMDGYAVARAFRADASLRNVHLVALSGYALPQDLKRAAEAGFERHLAKPPSLEQLQEVLRAVGSPRSQGPS